MTSTSNLADVVRHYQRSIERHGEDETRLLHCITKLFNLPITFEHLQETGIGKTVNALRKINGEVGVAAKTLVTKWKAMVAAEEEPTAGHSNNNEEDSNRSNGRRSSDEDQDQENKGSNSSGGEDSRGRHKSKHEERHPKSSEHKSKSSSSNGNNHKTHSKSRSDSDKRHKSSSDDKTSSRSKDHDRHHKEQKSSKTKESISLTSAKSSSNHSNHKSSSDSSKQKHHSSSSSHKNDHSKSRHEKSKEEKPSHHHGSDQKLTKEKSDQKHKSSSTSSSSKSSSSKRTRSPQRLDDDSPKAKKPKNKPKVDAVEQQKDTADGFDSSMGANFDDVLGMLNMPISTKKNTPKFKSPHKPSSSISTIVNTGSAAVPNAAKRIATTTSIPSSRITSTRKPELLASSAKLEPLDPNIALELPTISNNYKPMPLNQTVMDVVFNQGLSSSVHRTPRINESEALAAGISSKTMRTKIYSGVRTGQILQVPKLFDLCIRVLQKNIDALEYTGGVPFDLLRPVLERATPHQLLNFEEYNPYLMEDSDVLWQQHVHRHCRSKLREEMETWREMFLRCEEEKAHKLSSIAESIKASQKISEAPVRKTQLAFVDSMVKPPRSVQRKQEQYGTKGKLIATPAARVAALSNVTPNAAKVGDARLRVLNSARDTAQVAAPMRNKKAPLMAKALQLIRGRNRR